MRYLSRPLIAALIGAACFAACGSSSGTTKLHLHPAAGTISGVVGHGTSVSQDPTGKGRQYSCSPGLRTASLNIGSAVNYNGTDLQESDDTDNFTDKDGTFFYQTTATIKLQGNLRSFSSKAVSLIVSSTDGNNYTDPSLADLNGNAIDDRVVNLTSLIPETAKRVVIMLKTSDYVGFGYINSLKLCLHS